MDLGAKSYMLLDEEGGPSTICEFVAQYDSGPYLVKEINNFFACHSFLKSTTFTR
jgi:hypothetical protein